MRPYGIPPGYFNESLSFNASRDCLSILASFLNRSGHCWIRTRIDAGTLSASKQQLVFFICLQFAGKFVDELLGRVVAEVELSILDFADVTTR